MIVLVGTGPMAVHYAKVLLHVKRPFTVIGRGEQSACKFTESTGIPVIFGGIEQFLHGNSDPIQYAIVSVSVDQLFNVTSLLVDSGIKNILVEKPAGTTLQEIEQLNVKAQAAACSILVAYNRRFYSSVRLAKRLIDEDGGVTSFSFELTEWGKVIESVDKSKCVKGNWFLANTSHVADLAFYLGGTPKRMQSFTAGSLTWHSRSARFYGAGETDTGALFSYSGDWEAPGRWGVEVLTRHRRFILKPMEKLQVQLINSISIETIPLEDQFDEEFKPGLLVQVTKFLDGNPGEMCTLEEHVANSKLYSKMAGYL